MILSQENLSGTPFRPAEIAREVNIKRPSVSRIIDQDLDLHPLRKGKVQKVTDSNIEKRMTRSRNYRQSILRKHYKLHSLVTKRYLR